MSKEQPNGPVRWMEVDPGVTKTLEKKMPSFAFGFPTVIWLQDGSYLVTHWSKEQGHFGIRWTKLQIDW